jgi:protein involved in polysaccharide export with SLBB domain
MPKHRIVSMLASFLVAIVGMSPAQTSRPDEAPGTTAQAAGSYARDSQDMPALQQRHPRYRVMPSDTLSVSFPLSPEINEVATVQPDGYITLDNVGSLYIQGQTVPQIVDTLKKAYAKVLHDPIIDVDLTNFQRPQFTVSGQVGKPGQYELRADTTVTEAIAVAGGFLPTAKTQVFFFHRVDADWVEVKKLNVKEILHGRNVNEDVHLQPGDMLFVPEKFIANFRKYVPYSSGMYFNPSSVLF